MLPWRRSSAAFRTTLPCFRAFLRGFSPKKEAPNPQKTLTDLTVSMFKRVAKHGLRSMFAVYIEDIQMWMQNATVICEDWNMAVAGRISRTQHLQWRCGGGSGVLHPSQWCPQPTGVPQPEFCLQDAWLCFASVKHWCKVAWHIEDIDVFLMF